MNYNTDIELWRQFPDPVEVIGDMIYCETRGYLARFTTNEEAQEALTKAGFTLNGKIWTPNYKGKK